MQCVCVCAWVRACACGCVCVVQANTCVGIMIFSPTPWLLVALSMPAVLPRWGTADTHAHTYTHMQHLLAHLSHPFCFNIIIQQCVAAESSCRTLSEWCVWSLCSLSSLPSDTLCSYATPLVTHWTLWDTADPEGAFTATRSAPLKAFKLIFVSLTAFFPPLF